MRELVSNSGIKESYIWGYENQYPVVKIVTGDDIIVPAIDTVMLRKADQYSDDQIRAELSKIRKGLLRSKAQVFTYTYKPLVGLTSVTDPLDNMFFYEYDYLGRLSMIRDHDQNIIKKICYNYAGQAEDCILNQPSWQPTGNVRCIKDAANNNTGIQEKEEKDVQIGSATYNTLRWIMVGENQAACPIAPPCNTGNCTGIDKKCVNNKCETGRRVCTESIPLEGRRYRNTFHFVWSDGSMSQDYYETGVFACAIRQ